MGRTAAEMLGSVLLLVRIFVLHDYVSIPVPVLNWTTVRVVDRMVAMGGLLGLGQISRLAIGRGCRRVVVRDPLLLFHVVEKGNSNTASDVAEAVEGGGGRTRPTTWRSYMIRGWEKHGIA